MRRPGILVGAIVARRPGTIGSAETADSNRNLNDDND